MAPVDRRLRVFAWMVRRQGSIAGKSEAEVIALQARHMPDNAVTNFIFGKVAPGIEASNRTIPGPGGDIPVRVYRGPDPVGRAGPGGTGSSGTRPLILYFHGGGFVLGELRMGDWLPRIGAESRS